MFIYIFFWTQTIFLGYLFSFVTFIHKKYTKTENRLFTVLDCSLPILSVLQFPKLTEKICRGCRLSTVDTSQTVFSKCRLCRKRRNYLLWYMSPFTNVENAIVNNIRNNTWSPRGKGKMEYSTKFVQGNDVKYFIRLFFEHSFEKLTFNSKKLNTSKICKSKHRTGRDYGVNNKT